jgi:predicted Zn finger-like uncharacterized protein
MIVECRFCHARFRMDDSLFQGSKGVRVRCRKCGEITAVRNPKISFSPQRAEMRSMSSPSLSQEPPSNGEPDVALLPPPAPQSKQVSRPEPKGIVTPTGKTAVPEQMEPSAAGNSIGEGIPSPPDTVPPGKRRPSEEPSVDAMLSKKIAVRHPAYRLIPPKPVQSRRGLLIVVLLILLLIGGAGYLGFTQAGNEVLERISRGMESFLLGGSRGVSPYRIQDVSAYYVPISTSEKYFILEGKVMNGGEAARRGIRVRITLLNGKSRAIAEKTVYAGNVFTDKELRQMDRESIEEASSRRLDEDSDDMVILPDKFLPFMAVFFDLQESVASYQVTAIGSP